jgi:predicted Zn-dependent peptidase
MKITHTKTSHYTLNIGHTTQFKTIKLQITFNNALQEETVTARALLPYMMKAITKHYKRRKDIQEHLENLYSASFQAGVKKVGLSQEIAFDLTLIDDSYVNPSKPLLEQGFAFLYEVLFQPDFTEKIFLEEKRLLQEYFISIYNNKMRYAMNELHHNMYQGQPYHLQPLGRLEDLESMTLQHIKDAYQSMLKHDTININVVGDVSEAVIKEYIDTYLPFQSNQTPLTLLDTSKRLIQEVNTIVETQDVMQGKFVLGYQLPAYYGTDNYYKAVVFNTLLGGNPESLLFKRIREELNKVYFIGSSYDQYKGSLYIYGGINPEEYDMVIQEISTIIESIKRNDYPKHRLEIAKKTLINGLIESFDSPGSLASRVNHLSLFHKTFDPEQLIQKIQTITELDIQKMASVLQLDTTFFLRGEES